MRPIVTVSRGEMDPPIALTLEHPPGSTHFWLTLEEAESLAEDLRRAVRMRAGTEAAPPADDAGRDLFARRRGRK
ncbi:MAG: hypothetical protein WDA25_01075 [Paracoccaceae bacterium]